MGADGLLAVYQNQRGRPRYSGDMPWRVLLIWRFSRHDRGKHRVGSFVKATYEITRKTESLAREAGNVIKP